MSSAKQLGFRCAAVAVSSLLLQRTFMTLAPSAMSPVAAVQYMFDIRHTTLGAKWARRQGPPLAAGDLEGKLVLVTGGTGGIGFAAAKALAAAGAEVHVTGRSAERGELATFAAEAFEGRIIFHQVDLGSVTGAKDFMKTFVTGPLGGRRLDLLVQNLASMHGENGRNADGHERTLGTNLLNFYVCAKQLAPHFAVGARMINVVSAGQHLFRLRLEDLEALNAESETVAFDGIRAYSLTHRARVLLSERWAHSLGVAVVSVHPGWVETAGLREAAPMALFYSAMKHFLRDEDEGADTIAWLAAPTTPVASEALNGGYFWDRQRRAVDLPMAGTVGSSEELDRIIAWLEKMTV